MTLTSDEMHQLQHMITKQAVNHLMEELEKGLPPEEIEEIERDHTPSWEEQIAEIKKTGRGR